MPADTFRSTAKTRRRRIGSCYRHTRAFSAAVATQPFLPDISFGPIRRGSVQRPSIVTVLCYTHLRRNRFQLHVPPAQWLTMIAPLSEIMFGTRKTTVVSRSSTSQAPHSTIQVLQSQIVMILEPVNLEEDDAILGTSTETRATTVLNATAVPLPHPHSEDIPPPPPCPQAPPPSETKCHSEPCERAPSADQQARTRGVESGKDSEGTSHANRRSTTKQTS